MNRRLLLGVVGALALTFGAARTWICWSDGASPAQALAAQSHDPLVRGRAERDADAPVFPVVSRGAVSALARTGALADLTGGTALDGDAMQTAAELTPEQQKLVNKLQKKL